MTKIKEKEPEEKLIQLKSLELGGVFRLPNISFTRAMANDDGACFYHVLGQPKDGLIEIISVDFKNRRKLPEETDVIHHPDVDMLIAPNLPMKKKRKKKKSVD